MAIKADFTLRELAFVLVEAKVVVFKSLENTTKVRVMGIFPFPKTTMSSEMFLHPGRPVRCSLIDSWKISDAAYIPNGRRLKRLRPTWVLNVVTKRLSCASSSWWYPEERSSVLK